MSRLLVLVESYPEAEVLGSDEKAKLAVQNCEKFVEQCAKWCYLHHRRREAAALYEKLGRYTLRR